MTQKSNYNNEVRDESYIAIQPWVEWKHVTMGKIHCPTCLKLDKCWFTEANMPKIPQHARCHCKADPKSTQTVLREARAVSAYEKFAKYALDPTNPRNKGKSLMFESWGYTAADSEWLMTE